MIIEPQLLFGWARNLNAALWLALILLMLGRWRLCRLQATA